MTNTAARLGRPVAVAVAVLAMGVAPVGATSASAAPSAPVSAAVNAAGSASGGAAGRLGPYGYGGVTLGMSAKQAQKTRRVVKKFGGGGGCSGWDLRAHPTGADGAGLFISKKRGVAVIFAPRGVRTPEGIGIGSTRRQVEKAYPHLRTAASGYPVTTVPGNRRADYVFLLSRGGKVYQLALSLKTQDCVN
ncbi:hypothetical protein AAH991_09530 [Microbispora sp. ZYX-F-249]|uniref:Uncharacterized protein n=1 Tax=Microbispora maris TaxID=3144104 RepID=A0ABV0AMB9_9ACTN